jgi:hypothetical protein
LCALQTGCPYDLTLIGSQSTEDDAGTESAIHLKLQRDWMRGEWFKATKQVTAAAHHVASGLVGEWLKDKGMDAGAAKAMAFLKAYKLKEFDIIRHFAKRHAGSTERVRYG